MKMSLPEGSILLGTWNPRKQDRISYVLKKVLSDTVTILTKDQLDESVRWLLQQDREYGVDAYMRAINKSWNYAQISWVTTISQDAWINLNHALLNPSHLMKSVWWVFDKDLPQQVKYERIKKVIRQDEIVFGNCFYVCSISSYDTAPLIFKRESTGYVDGALYHWLDGTEQSLREHCFVHDQTKTTRSTMSQKDQAKTIDKPFVDWLIEIFVE